MAMTGFTEVIGKKGGQTISLLDIGCGSCEEGEELLESGFLLTGIDQDGETIQRVRKRLPAGRFITEDAAHWLEIQDDAYDVILIRRPDLAHRPKNWHRIFQLLPTALKADGMVIATTPGEREMMICRKWLEESGGVIEAARLKQTEEEFLVKAKNLVKSDTEKNPVEDLIRTLSWNDSRPHMVCDLRTGRCTAIEDVNLENDGSQQ